jgi:hypothetical protein
LKGHIWHWKQEPFFIAMFFSLTIYDKESLNPALVLLNDETKEDRAVIYQEMERFGNELIGKDGLCIVQKR